MVMYRTTKCSKCFYYVDDWDGKEVCYIKRQRGDDDNGVLENSNEIPDSCPLEYYDNR